MMSNKTKIGYIFLAMAFLFIAVSIVQADWDCSGVCAGCTLLNCTAHPGSECCAYYDHTYLDKVWCCYPDSCYYIAP